MSSTFKRICLLAVAVAVCAPGLFADTLTLTGVNPSGANLGGVYTGPYVATINGVSNILVICDDFQTHTALNQQFTVTETLVSDLTGSTANQVVKFDRDDAAQQQADYMTAAYLAIQLLGVNQSTAAGRLQASLINYAIWNLFYDGAINALTSSQKTSVLGYLSAAESATLGHTVDMYSNVSVWTPTPNSAAQEFISVRVPEPAFVDLLGFYAIAVVALGWFARRRGIGLAG